MIENALNKFPILFSMQQIACQQIMSIAIFSFRHVRKMKESILFLMLQEVLNIKSVCCIKISGEMNSRECDLSLHFMLEHSFHLVMMMNLI